MLAAVFALLDLTLAVSLADRPLASLANTWTSF
jgi:hypothetical protein